MYLCHLVSVVIITFTFIGYKIKRNVMVMVWINNYTCRKSASPLTLFETF